MVTPEMKAGDFRDVACAVTHAKLAWPQYEMVGQGDVVADERAARHIRVAARAIYNEIAEEMEKIMNA